MKNEHGKIDGDLRVQEEFNLHGMVTGSVRVDPRGILRLHGMVSRDLVLEPSSHADLYGMVIGNVVNRGGHLRVFGMINGALHHEAGETLVHPGAVVQGGIVGSTGALEESS